MNEQRLDEALIKVEKTKLENEELVQHNHELTSSIKENGVLLDQQDLDLASR